MTVNRGLLDLRVRCISTMKLGRVIEDYGKKGEKVKVAFDDGEEIISSIDEFEVLL